MADERKSQEVTEKTKLPASNPARKTEQGENRQ